MIEKHSGSHLRYGQQPGRLETSVKIAIPVVSVIATIPAILLFYGGPSYCENAGLAAIRSQTGLDYDAASRMSKTVRSKS